MENNDALLRRVLNLIKKGMKWQDKKDASDEEVVEKIGVSKVQLEAYLSGKEKIPDDLIKKLMSFYDARIVEVTDTIVRQIEIPPDEGGGDVANDC